MTHPKYDFYEVKIKDTETQNEDVKPKRQSNTDNLSHHILPNSATMVGVCIMVISIVKNQPSGLAGFLIDKALAIDSILFMLSACISFYSIRSKQSAAFVERWAEIIFLIGLASMTLIAVIFAFEII